VDVDVVERVIEERQSDRNQRGFMYWEFTSVGCEDGWSLVMYVRR